MHEEAAPDLVVQEPPLRRADVYVTASPLAVASISASNAVSCADDVGERDRVEPPEVHSLGEHLDPEALREERCVLEDVVPRHPRAAQRLDADELGQGAAAELDALDAAARERRAAKIAAFEHDVGERRAAEVRLLEPAVAEHDPLRASPAGNRRSRRGSR